MKTTTTTVTENHNSGEITDFENKEIFTNGSDLAIVMLDVKYGTYCLLDVKAGHISHVDLTKEQVISVLNICKYRRFG